MLRSCHKPRTRVAYFISNIAARVQFDIAVIVILEILHSESI